MHTNEWRNKKFCTFLFIVCEVAHQFVAVCKIWVVKGIVPVVEGLNIISLYAIDNPITRPEQPIYSIQNVRTFAR